MGDQRAGGSASQRPGIAIGATALSACERVVGCRLLSGRRGNVFARQRAALVDGDDDDDVSSDSRVSLPLIYPSMSW